MDKTQPPLFFRVTILLSLVLLTACENLGLVRPPAAPPPPQEACICPAQTPQKPLTANCSTSETQMTEAPKPSPTTVYDDELTLLGYVEEVSIQPNKLTLKARVDTGAGISSLNAQDITAFERDGAPWVHFLVKDTKSNETLAELEYPVKRYATIKQLSGKNQRRPVITIPLKLGKIEEQVEVTLSDRSGYLYPVLIGRNFLRDRAIVDVSQKYIAKPK